ncbi:MAG: hypothetical protein KF853_09535 [Rhodocyclaceae bacterium]|nr:hypothetical protein [Rhodocyclaceae bacterium]
MDGGADADVVFGGEDGDTILGGAGNDFLSGDNRAVGNDALLMVGESQSPRYGEYMVANDREWRRTA